MTALDDVDGSTPVTCAPPSGTKFPVGVTTVTCSSTDAAGNTGTDTFDVTVTFTPPATPDGRIYGIGHVDDGKHHHFVFRVSEIGNRDYGRFEYWVNDRTDVRDDDDDYARHRERSGDHDATTAAIGRSRRAASKRRRSRRWSSPTIRDRAPAAGASCRSCSRRRASTR